MLLFKNNKGFTFVELILVIMFITIIAGFSIPIYQRFQTSNDLELATIEMAQTLRRAQALSRANDGDSNWGVYVESSQILLFKGNSYATRDNSFDEIFVLPDIIKFSGLNEIVFDKISGGPQSIGSIILTSDNNEERAITINSRGTLEY